MIAAEKDDRIAAAGPGRDDRRDRRRAQPGASRARAGALEQATRPRRQATVELQKRIQSAVLTGKGWDGIPAPLATSGGHVVVPELPRHSTPRRSMRDIPQPMLVVQGMLDKQVDPSQRGSPRVRSRARQDQVEACRDRQSCRASTTCSSRPRRASIDEYATLSDPRVSPAVTEAIVSWLQKTWTVSAR